MKMLEFLFKFHWNLFLRVQLQLVSIRSGNGLAPNKRQAIIWSNDDPVYQRIYAALGGDGLKKAVRSIPWRLVCLQFEF